jgi:hypothetical protein
VFFPDPPVSSTYEIERHDITEILLKVALSTIKQTNKEHTSHKTKTTKTKQKQTPHNMCWTPL